MIFLRQNCQLKYNNGVKVPILKFPPRLKKNHCVMSVLRIKGLQLDFNSSAPMPNSFSILATNEKPLSLVNSDINLP